MKRRIVLLGPPASGKGTQAQMISAKYGLPAASTGALLREERARGTALGREADEWTRTGKFFPDEIALRVVRQWMDAHGEDSFILDGFPRTVGQARAFDKELGQRGTPLTTVFHLEVPDDVIRERVAARITCTQCGASFSGAEGVRVGSPCPACGETLVRRRDDTPEALEERLHQERLHTVPVVEYYRSGGRLSEIDASRPRDAVFQNLRKTLEELPR